MLISLGDNTNYTHGPELERIMADIAAGKLPSQEQLLPLLLAEDKSQRCLVNFKLAEAYFKSSAGNLPLAQVCVQRAWLLSGFSPEVLELFVAIHAAAGDVESIRSAYKRVGIEYAKRKNVERAVYYFNEWHYTYAHLQRVDKFEYDFDILESLNALADAYNAPVKSKKAARKDKIVVGYLLKGALEQNSVLIKLNLLFAKYHDHSRFRIIVFVPESHEAVAASVQGAGHLESFAGYGCEVVVLREENYKKRLLNIGREIQERDVDVLVTSAGVADFAHYFITRLCPGVANISLIQGPPPQFASPAADWGVSWTKHPILDSPVGASLVKMELEYLSREDILPAKREDFNLPADALVLLSAGRHVKFQDEPYWRAILDVLGSAPQAHYLVIGAKREQIPFLDAMLAPSVAGRVHFVGWADHYQRLLLLADVYLDTYPSGGGVTLEESMALGIPFVSFENNYLRVYDQVDWSPAQELMYSKASIVPRGDFAAFKTQLLRLIGDPELRRELGRLCQEHILTTKSKPARAVSKCEAIFEAVLRRRKTEEENPGRKDWSRPGAPGPDFNAYKVEKLLGMVAATIGFRIRKKIKRMLSL
jgi:glycosyltransferase involved in cell wall biosynthesis